MFVSRQRESNTRASSYNQCVSCCSINVPSGPTVATEAAPTGDEIHGRQGLRGRTYQHSNRLSANDFFLTHAERSRYEIMAGTSSRRATMSEKPPVLTTENLGQFFFDAIEDVCARQQLSLEDETRIYLVRLLEHFTQPQALIGASQRTAHRALALLMAEATAARREAERRDGLRRLGDIALFIAGFFPGSLRRRPVDVDYYVGMGGTAYGLVADMHTGARWTGLRQVFSELAEKFGSLVDLLDDLLTESAFGSRREDALRMHEAWLATGGAVYGGKLTTLGIVTPTGRARH